MNARVVEVHRSNAKQLRQRRPWKPALREQLGTRRHAALDRKRADHLGGAYGNVPLRNEPVKKLGEVPPVPHLERYGDVEVREIGEYLGPPLRRLGQYDGLGVARGLESQAEVAISWSESWPKLASTRWTGKPSSRR
jgi:hypothetical protein